jgi:hypothetical protein
MSISPGGCRFNSNPDTNPVDAISQERRTGYSWEGDYGIQAAIDYYEQVKAAGREAYLARRNQSVSGKPPESEIRRITAALNAIGLWITNGRVETRVFIRNIERLCEYLESR